MPDVEVIELSPAEYSRVARAELRKLGLTYPELEKQARNRQFSTEDARKLWLAIGGRRPR